MAAARRAHIGHLLGLLRRLHPSGGAILCYCRCEYDDILASMYVL